MIGKNLKLSKAMIGNKNAARSTAKRKPLQKQPSSVELFLSTAAKSVDRAFQTRSMDPSMSSDKEKKAKQREKR